MAINTTSSSAIGKAVPFQNTRNVPKLAFAADMDSDSDNDDVCERNEGPTDQFIEDVLFNSSLDFQAGRDVAAPRDLLDQMQVPLLALSLSLALYLSLGTRGKGIFSFSQRVEIGVDATFPSLSCVGTHPLPVIKTNLFAIIKTNS